MSRERAEQSALAGMEVVVREHHARLRAFLYSRVHDRDAADDLGQEVFLVVFKRYNELDFARPVWPLLVGIAKNKIRQYWQARMKELPTESLETFTAEQELRLAGESREEEAHGDRLDALKACVDQLAPDARRIVELTYDKSLRSEDVAAQVKKNASAIRVALHRTRAWLLDCIRRRLEHAPA